MNKKLKKVALLIILSLSMPLFAEENKFNIMLDQAIKEAGEVEAKQLMKMIEDGKNVILLDVREIEQRAEGNIHVDESTVITQYAITRGVLEFHIADMIKDKDATIVAFCRSGGMGAFAAQTLRHLGYKNATNLKNGLKGWVKEGYLIKTGLGATKVVTDTF